MRLAGLAPGLGTRLQHIAEFDVFFARAEQQYLPDVVRQRFKRRFQIKAVMLGQALQHGEVIRIAFVPAFDGAAGQADVGECDDARRIEKTLFAQAFAVGTSAQR